MNFAHWPQMRSRFIFSRRDIRGIDAPLASATKDGVLLRDDLDISVWNPESDVSGYKLVEPDDFVIGLRSFQHGISHSDVRGNVSPAYTVLRGGSAVDPRFYRHYFRSARFISELANLTQGIRQGQSIDIEAFANLRIPVPPLEEQRRIASFLDVETARIDDLIELRNLQHERLDARLQSHLSQMAKELSERYGEIKVRHVLQKIEQGWSPQCEDRPAAEGEWGVVKAGCVNGGVFDATQHKTLPLDVEPEIRYRLRPGDLLMSRASGSVDLIGSIGVIPNDFSSQMLLCDKVYRLHMDHTRMTPHFVAPMLRTYQVRENIKLGISGADGMANNLPTGTVAKLTLPEVPLSEQRRIVNDLNVNQDTVRKSKNALARQLRLLVERRQSLITAAVTGQADVTTARSLSALEGVAV